MSLTNYAELVTAVQNWLDDDTIAARIPEMIALAEAEFNRRLATGDMEKTVTATATSPIALPASFGGAVSVRVGTRELTQKTFAEIADMNDSAGTPIYFAIADGQMHFRPTPVSGTATVVFYERVPSLTALASTNWLMTAHPDLYLLATILQAEFYGWNDSRLATVKARVDEIFDQIESDDQARQFGNKGLYMSAGVYPAINQSVPA